MAAATIETRGVAHRAAPRLRPAKANRITGDAARLIRIGVLPTLGFLGLTGIAAELAAAAPPPVSGPVPGFP
jgi:hypothetical protein